MGYQRKDFYFKKAKAENFAARSVYKIEEIDKKYRLFRKGDRVMDLGAAPGSWSQYTSKVIGPQGKILGVDIQPVGISLPNAVFIAQDLRTLDLKQVIAKYRDEGFDGPFDAVISDMAPNTTGIKITDQARSMALCELALDVAIDFLKSGGHFVCKMFHSEDFEAYRVRMKKHFKTVEVIRPKSTRKESKEIFFIGLCHTLSASVGD